MTLKVVKEKIRGIFLPREQEYQTREKSKKGSKRQRRRKKGREKVQESQRETSSTLLGSLKDTEKATEKPGKKGPLKLPTHSEEWFRNGLGVREKKSKESRTGVWSCKEDVNKIVGEQRNALKREI